MKKVKYISFWLLFAMSVFPACEEGGDEGDKDVPVTAILLTKNTLSLLTGAEEWLIATVEPDDATDNTVAWSSNDASKASVDNGRVKALAEGTATITAKAGNKTASCLVTVKDPPLFVMINQVKWATRNVDEPGKFADKPENAGKFYQWNRKVAWPASGAVSGWNKTIPAGVAWEKANDPSPDGWRVPSMEEMNKLRDADKVNVMFTKQNNTNGWKFKDKATGDSLFLPMPGYRNGSDGMLFGAGAHAYYWLNLSFRDSENEEGGCFELDSNTILGRYEYRCSGFNVRSVAAE